MGDGKRILTEDQPADLSGKEQEEKAAEKLRDDALNGRAAKPAGDQAADPLKEKREGDKSDKGAKADDSAERRSEKANLSRLQDVLSRVLPTVNPELLKDLAKEKEKGEFGPASKKALEETVKWLRSNVTDTLAALDKQGLPIPPGCPIPLPTDKSGLPVIDSYYRSLISQRRLALDVNTDASRVPSERDLDKLANAIGWYGDAANLLATTTRKFETERLAKTIEALKRPEWLPPKDASDAELQRWYAAAAPTVDLAMKVRNYAEAIASLRQAGGVFPDDGIKPENFPGELKFDDKGKIIDIKLDLPKDLRQTPENAAKLQRLNEWLEKYHKPVDQAIEELVKAAADQNRLLIWEDIPEAGHVKLDKDGKVIPELLKDKTDGKEVKYNLVSCRFDVETLPDGRIKVTNSRQHYRSHWYNYLDIGADEIGKEVKGEERIYNPHDFVPVIRGGKVEIMRADNLASWRRSQMAWHYGEKVATVALDVGMLVTGTIEIGAAVKAARAGELAFRAAAAQALKGSFRVAIGGTGLFNNAAVKETDFGRKFLFARGAVMLADVTWGLGKGALGYLRGASAMEKAASASSIVDKTIKSSNWVVRSLDKGTKAGFLFADCVYAKVIGGQILDQIDTLRGKDQKPHLDDAVDQRGGGMGDRHQERAQNAKPKDKLTASREVIAGLAHTLETKDDQVRARVAELARSTQEALGLPENDGRRTKQQHELVKAFRAAGSTEEKIAAASGLLFMARKADGSLPDTISGAEGSIKTDDVIKLLETQVTTPGVSHANKLVAGEMLVRIGRLSGQHYAGILQDILTDANASRDLKVKAMIDANGPRLAIIMDALRVQERQGLGGNTAEERFAEMGKTYGLTSTDLEKTLLAVAKNAKEDPDVRAMAVSIVHALNRDNVEERNAMLQRCYNTWKELSAKEQNPGGAMGGGAGSPPEAKSYAETFIAAMKRDMAAQADPLDGNVDEVTARKFMAAAALSQLEGQGFTQQEINKALVESISQTRPDLALQALSKLVPDRLKDLTPEQMKVVRAETLNLLSQQTTESNMAAKLVLAGMVKPLFEGADQTQKTSAAQALEAMIRPSDPNYEGSHPDLRKAAIAALADLGSRASIPLILERLNAEKEPAAPVRLAALEALAKMKAPNLREIAFRLADRETDPSIAARVRDIGASGAELSPDSLDYKEAYWKAKEDLIRSSTRSLAGCPAWIKQNFPLLDGENFRHESWKRANDIYDHFGGNAHYIWDAITNWDSDIDEKKWKEARDQVRREFEGQMNSLIEKAKGTGADAEQAQKALTYIVLSNGRGFLDGWRDWAVAAAAGGLYDLCKPGVAGRDNVAWAIETCLMNQPKMDRVARNNLLNALTWLVYENPPKVSREEAAQAVAGALELEYRAMPKQGEQGYEESKKLQLEMIKHISSYGNPRVTPMLEAMAEEHPIPEVKQAAQQLVARFKPMLERAGNDKGGDAKEQERAKAARFLARRPDLTTVQYKQEFEKAKAELIKSTSRSTENSVDWLRSNYPLIDGEKYNSESRARQQAVYSGIGGTLDYIFSRQSTVDREYEKARNEVKSELEGQFKSLVERAKGNANGSDEARKALVQIIHSNGRPFLESWRDWAVNQASFALYELCKPGAPGRGDVVWAIETSLMNAPEISKNAKWNLLVGMDWLANANPPAVSKQEAATVLAAALETEYRTMPKAGEPGHEESKKIQLEMLRQLEVLGYKKIYPVLEAMVEHHPVQEIKQKAEQLLARMRDQVGAMRYNTTPDTVTPLDKRAENINAALTGKDVTGTCQAIFDACQGMPVTGADDPRVPALYRALSDSSERVRLAAAWVLLESANPADLEAALAVLAELSVRGSRLGYRTDATSLLDSVKKWGPSFERAVNRKLDAAKARK